MDLDLASWGGLELGLKIGPVKTSSQKSLVPPFGRSRSAAIASGLGKRPENGPKPETFFSTRLSTVR